MNKKNIFSFLFVTLLLNSCTFRSGTSYQSVSLDTGLIYSTSGRVKLVLDGSGDVLVQPFNTFISATMYLEPDTLTDDEITALEDEFQFLFSYYYALTDRHHSYTLDDQNLNNIKTINDSYGTGEAVKVDSFLYQALKSSYQFSIDSGGLFNIFIGTLSDLYEEKIEEAQLEYQTSLDKALTLSNNILFGQSFESEASELASTIPNTAEELTDLLVFDDENQTVFFNAFYKDGEKVDLAITLSGMSKGMATEYVSDYLEENYEDASILINSGSSSIKVIGRRPDDRDWKVTYMNPLYTEAISKSGFNSAEVYYEFSSSFAMSTSGYAENYFYTYNNDSTFERVGHIINPLTGLSESYFDQVSVFMDDSSLADMYTTALMNTSSLSQALELFDTLNSIYEIEAEMTLCFKEDEDGHYSYSMSDLSPLSSYNLPIVTLSNQSRYEGDYSDIEPDDISSSITSAERDFKMIYLMTSDIYEQAGLIEDETFVSSSNVFYAEIQEIIDD